MIAKATRAWLLASTCALACGGRRAGKNAAPTALLVAARAGATESEGSVRIDLGERVSLDAIRSWDPDGTIVEYAWEFGDGSARERSGAGTRQHLFAREGEFAACVTVVDNRGAHDFDCVVVVVVGGGGETPGGDAGVDAALDAPSDGAVACLCDAPPADGADARPADGTLVDAAQDAASDAGVDPDGALTECGWVAPGGSGAGGYVEVATGPCFIDVAGVGASLGIDGDDEGASDLALPFAVDFFGETATQYGVSSNGYVQLEGSNGYALDLAGNVPMPDEDDPQNLIAPLWDDLAPRIVEGTNFSDVLVATVGAAPQRRFVVQWIAWSFFGAGDQASLTFQAQIHEGSNVVEFQYASLEHSGDPARAAGDEATVGLENEDGTRAAQHSANEPGAVSISAGVRFIPE
ncbi:MAG: PKD domain-containing protein [Myxococcota bacterium]